MTEDLKNAFETFPLADVDEIDDESNVTIPAEEDVEDAKEWVDFKEM